MSRFPRYFLALTVVAIAGCPTTDDDHNVVAETHTFAQGLPEVHGLAFSGGFLYFSTGENVWKTPYASGQRTEMAAMRTMVSTFPTVEAQRWTHGIAASQDGTVY